MVVDDGGEEFVDANSGQGGFFPRGEWELIVMVGVVIMMVGVIVVVVGVVVVMVCVIFVVVGVVSVI